MNNPEILAPAGNPEQLVAAVRCGANAVYMGTKRFNARANAANFDESKFMSAVRYCHARDVKVYAVMNTLVTDEELGEVVKEIDFIAKSGADAVIIQDLAVAELWKKLCPSMKLHASTQMTVHNVPGAKAAVEMGFKRIIPARELSLAEIAAIAEAVDAEIEVFVHGALCVSASGTCLLSSMLGARSGNRGKCAQPCRLNFKVRDRSFALSLKDLSLIDKLDSLIQAGVTSFKIEGRMKRPEYAAAAVTAVKKALMGEEYDTEQLQAVFSRNGFTSGYLDGKRSLDMFGYRRKEDVVAAMPALKELATLYKDEYKRIPIKMTFTADEEQSSLTVFDGKNTVTEQGDKPAIAINRPLDNDYATKCLKKTGGTIFYSEDMELDISPKVTLTASQLNAMRRSALDKLYALRYISEPRQVLPLTENTHHSSLRSVSPKFRVRFERFEQAFDHISADKIILPLREVLKHPEAVEKFGKKLICELPALVFDSREQFGERLNKLHELGVTHVAAANIGQLYAAKEAGFTVHGDWGLNILNSVSLEKYCDLGASDITVSPELSAAKIEKLTSPVPKGILGYGFLPLMRFRACPAQTEEGCKGCKGLTVVKDRFDTPFYILCSEKKYSSLLNSVPLYTGGKIINNVDFITLYFTFESDDSCKKIFGSFVSKRSLSMKKTAGLYFRDLL